MRMPLMSMMRGRPIGIDGAGDERVCRSVTTVTVIRLS